MENPTKWWNKESKEKTKGGRACAVQRERMEPLKCQEICTLFPSPKQPTSEFTETCSYIFRNKQVFSARKSSSLGNMQSGQSPIEKLNTSRQMCCEPRVFHLGRGRSNTTIFLLGRKSWTCFQCAPDREGVVRRSKTEKSGKGFHQWAPGPWGSSKLVINNKYYTLLFLW